MNNVVRKLAPLAMLAMLIALTMGATNPQVYPQPTGVTVENTPEGHVQVSWNRDGAPVHRVGWAHEAEGIAASAAGDWMEAFHFADTRRPRDYTIKYLPSEQKYFFVVGAARARFAPVGEWSEWTNLVTSSASGQPVAGPRPVQPMDPQRELTSSVLTVLTPRTYAESVLDCEVYANQMVNYRMSAEFLVEANRHTGDLEPMLATRWSLSPDGRTWNFKLRRDVRWHDRWGQFNARDVAHSMAYYTNPECRGSYSGYFRDDVGAEVQIVNDHEVNIRSRQRPAVDMLHWISGYRGLPISSKAQWDQGCPNGAADYVGGYCAASRDRVNAKPARTGPYEYASYNPDRHRWEWRRVDYDHWRINPVFPTIAIIGVDDASTRLALVAAGQGHIGDVNRAHLIRAGDQGLRIAKSAIPVNSVFGLFGGLYYSSETAASRDEEMPWNIPGDNGRKVRMAMNKAIDRGRINRELFGGQTQRQWVGALTPNFPGGYDAGYRPEWESRWRDLYGFDPRRARELLAEAGYPNGFSFRVPIYSLPSAPELEDVMEMMEQNWMDVGLKPSLVRTPYNVWRNNLSRSNTDCCVYPFTKTAAPIDTLASAYFGASGIVRAYTSSSVEGNINRAINATNAATAATHWQSVSDELFHQAATIPGWVLPAEAVVYPRVVSEYAFLGPNHGTYIYLEYAKGVTR